MEREQKTEGRGGKGRGEIVKEGKVKIKKTERREKRNYDIFLSQT